MKYTDLKSGDRFHPPDHPLCYIPSVFGSLVSGYGLCDLIDPSKSPEYMIVNYVTQRTKRGTTVVVRDGVTTETTEFHRSTVRGMPVKLDGTLVNKVWRDGVLIWEGIDDVPDEAFETP